MVSSRRFSSGLVRRDCHFGVRKNVFHFWLSYILKMFQFHVLEWIFSLSCDLTSPETSMQWPISAILLLWNKAVSIFGLEYILFPVIAIAMKTICFYLTWTYCTLSKKYCGWKLAWEVVTEYIAFAQFFMSLGILKISRLHQVLTGIFHPQCH